MKKDISDIQKKLLAFINNINELIVLSNKRREAKMVMLSMVEYAKQKNFYLPEEKINEFYAILLDARNQTISYVLYSISQDIVNKR